MVFKITHGYVKQQFDEHGKCVKQDFFAGDVVEYQDENFIPITPYTALVSLKGVGELEYFPFAMVQPEE